MRLREVRVKNFRNLVDITVPIDDTTVLVGENNSGKTAFLRALQIVLPRTPAGRATPFEEYDYHMAKPGASPQTSDGITIELWFREDVPKEWPDSLVQALNEIIQTDPVGELNAIGLRLSSAYDQSSKEMMTRWEFLNLAGEPLGGKGAQPRQLGSFLQYVRLFYLSALRDSEDEFSPRSQYWGRILRDLKIPEADQKTLSEELAKLNDKLLKADARLDDVIKALGQAQGIVALTSGQETSIQALPLRPWDLMARAEVVMKLSGSDVHFPLTRHGQGIQSLAVLFLFEAYIEVLLKPTFQPETEAILALEEPEAHLHPQATRALAAYLSEAQSQTIVSTHSPYFVQEVPFPWIRMFRRRGLGTRVCYVRRKFQVELPQGEALQKLCENSKGKYDFHPGAGVLTIHGRMEEKEFRELLTIFAEVPDTHPRIRSVYEESRWFLSEAELADLDRYAKRIRGEVLFARAWLLCEGQSDYVVLRYFAELLGKPLDRTGVALIDFQNNGSPGAFVGLARAFEMPWIMVCDNDAEGKRFVKQVQDRGLTGPELALRVRPLPGDGTDLEAFLGSNGFLGEYVQVLQERSIAVAAKPTDVGYAAEVIGKIRTDKEAHALALVRALRATGAGQDRVPPFLRSAIEDAVKAADES
jgi:putative ATP-dependent endonuclease of OLD family